MKSVAIMQPYFLPYIGYYQLIAASEIFIIYDNIKYTKKGWINRNRILQNNTDVIVTLPLKAASDALDICKRELAQDFNRVKLLNQFNEAYRRAPNFGKTYPLIEQILDCDDTNLFRFLHQSIVKTCEYLGIKTEIKISSDININHNLKSQDKVLSLCNEVGASVYINPIGGIEIYSRSVFQSKNIKLKFIRSRPFNYQQFENEFISSLSIIDVMMFNSIEVIREVLSNGFDLEVEDHQYNHNVI
jgi:hypothetical protein